MRNDQTVSKRTKFNQYKQRENENAHKENSQYKVKRKR